jgi:hypothetical protein
MVIRMDMADSTIIMSLAGVALFCNYLSLGNPSLLVPCLSIVGILISRTKLINYKYIFYPILLSIILIQSVILIKTYLFTTVYLQNIKEYGLCTFGVFTYIMLILVFFKPNIYNKDLK